MAKLFVTSINLNKNEIQNARIQNLVSAPLSPVPGQIYFDTTDDVLKFYSGSSWVNATGIGEVTFPDTGVIAGSYGSSSAIPTFTVDEKGRLTAAGTVSVATQLDLGADNAHGGYKLDLATDSVKFVGGEGIDTNYLTDGTLHTITIAAEDATTSNKGIASFDNSDFSVTNGHVSLSDNITIGNDLIVGGNLTVNGTVTSVNTETTTLNDNIIVLNNNETGNPSQNAGIEVERGSANNVSIIWNETSDQWTITDDGSHYFPITRKYTATIGDGLNTSYSLTHDLGTHDYSVQIRDALTNQVVEADIELTSTTTATISFASAPASNSYKVVIIG